MTFNEDEIKRKVKEWFLRRDLWLLAVFQSLTHHAARYRISSAILVNMFLVIQIAAQSTQIIFLHLAGKSIVSVCLMAFPTWLVIIYFFHMIKRSKQGKVVSLDASRLFALAFACLEIFFFIYRYTLSIIFHHSGTIEKGGYLQSEVAYIIAWTAFPCVIYALSSTESYQKLLKEHKQ